MFDRRFFNLFRKKDNFLKKMKITRGIPDIEPQEVILDRLSQKKEGEIKSRFEVAISRKNFLILGGIFFLLFSIIFGKSFHLQVLDYQKLLELSEKNSERIYQTVPSRGVIYDREMQQLVWNKPAYDLVCEKMDLPSGINERKENFSSIERILRKEAGEIEKKIEESEISQVLIEENLSHDLLVLLEAKIEDFSGFRIEKNTVRDYKDENLSHLLGYTRKISKEEMKEKTGYTISDYIGKAGLEQYYEEILRGIPGKIKIQKDVFGKDLQENLISSPVSGKGLILSLDYNLQKKLSEEMEKSISRIGAEKGAAVALDPRTGEVLALVSFPEFKANLFSQGITSEEWLEISGNLSEPLFNRVLSGIGYPTGSAIKPLIGIAALEEEIITANTTINCPAQICIWNRYSKKDECYKDWTYPEAHGISDIKRAIAESINPFFYIIGGGYEDFQGLGAEKILKYFNIFRLGEKTGIDLPGEGKGILPEIDESWHLGSTYHLSIGQGPFTATPLGMTAAFAAIANGGKLLKPFVVKKIVDNSDPSQIIEEKKPEVLKEYFLNNENLRIIKEGMRQAVTSGSALILNDLPSAAAAKTGTAQSSREKYYHHWVCLFAPYENPEIVLTIIIEDVKGIQSATLPVAREVLKEYFSSPEKE
jgi:penicillin-binding protein 2